MIVLDTSGLLAALDASEPEHGPALAALGAARPPLLVSPFVLAELDYLLTTRRGERVALEFLDDVARGAYRLEPFGAADVAAAIRVIRRHAGLGLGLADASVVVLAERAGTRDVLTLDERHFRAISEPVLRLLPADT